jgi:hypothetical protein
MLELRQKSGEGALLKNMEDSKKKFLDHLAFTGKVMGFTFVPKSTLKKLFQITF